MCRKAWARPARCAQVKRQHQPVGRNSHCTAFGVEMAEYAFANPTCLTKKWPRLRGHFPSVVIPIMVMTPDDYHSVAIVVVPATMPPAIMSVELSTRAAI